MSDDQERWGSVLLPIRLVSGWMAVQSAAKASATS